MKTVELSKAKLIENVNNRSSEEIFEEAANRFEYFFNRIYGTFSYPHCHPQIQQVLDIIAIGVATKQSEATKDTKST